MGVVTKRSTMTFFSDARNHYSHRVRIVLAEKGVTVDVINVDPKDIPQELSEINPYSSLPTLVDRDLVVYETRVMMEYLDERFPHPPLLPVYPVARAEIRQFIHRVESDWCPWVDVIIRDQDKDLTATAREGLRSSLISIAPIFADKPYFMSDEFTLVDCCLSPILWRLGLLGIDMPVTRQTAPLHDYMKRVFGRESFKVSLTDQEKSMHFRAKT